MIRKIICINEEKCNGCGLCASACHEGAIEMIDGKARLVRENFCDGLGDCLPACPAGAITFEEREAPAYDEAAVKAAQIKMAEKTEFAEAENAKADAGRDVSQLNQWPCQIKLMPVQAPYFEDSDLLIAADCTAYAYADFHNRFMSGKITIIGCPKLDGIDYSEKLTEMFEANSFRSIMLLRMEVPCCGGLERAVKAAIARSGKEIPLQVITISRSGEIL